LSVLLGIVTISAVSTGAAPRLAPATHIAVKPTSGSPTTRFAVSFRTPDRTGPIGVLDRRDELRLDGPSGQAGCVSGVSRALPSAAAHARLTTSLDPEQLGGTWCVGAYRGRIDEIQGPACAKGKPCPEFASRLRTIGRFAFEISSSSAAAPPAATTPPTNSTPPAFAGVQSAFACTPGAQRPGETTPVTLTWTAASDTVTPSSQIVYDVFMATTAGGEDFSHPSWTTPPGVTRFTTPGLASHGTFFFVVRARDQTGNEDQNRVERRLVDPCV
jgi:hypothetical protein